MADEPVRLAAFQWLEEQVARHGEVLPWSTLLRGLTHEGVRVPLVSQQGIFKPRVCRYPLSIRTSPKSPYADSFSPEGLLQYKYRGSDPNHRENAGLRECKRLSLPLVFLYGHLPGRYHVVWPVFVVGDDPDQLTFTVAAHHDDQMSPGAWTAAASQIAERRYTTVEVRRRLHQQGFRERVLGAYRDSCAMCRLKHRELLDAAHIIADNDPLGEPVVPNGLALCKLHHAAFDQHIVAVDPDYRIIIRQDILEEVDGPMLKHGLQELHGLRIRAPKRAEWKPSRDFLAMRMEAFLAGIP